MITAAETQIFKMPNDTTVSICFFSRHGYGHVLRDHFLSETEPWSRIFRWNSTSVEILRQKVMSDDVSIREAAEKQTYGDCVTVLAKGIQQAIRLPLYIKFTQKRTAKGSPNGRCCSGFYFLAEEGFLVVVVDDVVRTAYFRTGIRKNLSRTALFREAWKNLKDKVRSEYWDSKGKKHVKHVEVTFMSSENWKTCPV